MLKRVLLSLIFVFALSGMALADPPSFPAPQDGLYTHGNDVAYFTAGQNMGNNGWHYLGSGSGGGTGGAGGNATVTNTNTNTNNNTNNNTNTNRNVNVNRNENRNTNLNNMNQRQAQGQIQGQSQGQEISGNNSGANVSITQNGAPIPRNFAIPGTVYYPSMPSEFLNDTQFANAQPVKFILQFGCVYNRAHLENMKGDGWVKTLQLVNLYGNKAEPADTDTITFLTELPKDLKLVKIGSIVSKAKTGGTTTEQVLGDMGLEALSIKGAKYVLISGEGIQKYTKTSGWGVALGYTQAGISDDGQRAGTGTAGIGYSSGQAGREANPFIHGTVLTDEATFKELTSAQPK